MHFQTKKQSDLSPAFLTIFVILIFLVLTFYRSHFFVLCRIYAPVYVKCRKIAACRFLSAGIHYRIVCWSCKDSLLFKELFSSRYCHGK